MIVARQPLGVRHALVGHRKVEAGAGFEELCWRILEQTLPEQAS